MKTVLSFIVLGFSISASALMLPINPAPEIIIQCTTVGSTVTCSNGVRCTTVFDGIQTTAQCSNRMVCTVREGGQTTCNDGNNCAVKGMNLYCQQGITCAKASPTSFTCHK